MTVPRTSVNLSGLRHSDLIYFTETAVIFTETAVIDPFILSSIDHPVNLRPALPENTGAYLRSRSGSPAKGCKDRADGRWPVPY
jgi:hypothetical protein